VSNFETSCSLILLCDEETSMACLRGSADKVLRGKGEECGDDEETFMFP